MKEIKVGDYIEGFEEIGPVGNAKVVKTRIIVSKIITEHNGNKLYEGQADDSYRGARGTMISEDLGEIRVITDEKPFSSPWWRKEIAQKKINHMQVSNGAVIMTEDKMCVLRGTARTMYELCLIDEKSKRKIREARGVKTAEQTAKHKYIRLSDKVAEFYGVDTRLYSEDNNKLPKLIGVKTRKILVIE